MNRRDFAKLFGAAPLMLGGLTLANPTMVAPPNSAPAPAAEPEPQVTETDAMYEAARDMYAKFKTGVLPLNPHFLEAMSLDELSFHLRQVMRDEVVDIYKAHPKLWTNYLQQGSSVDYRKMSRFTMDAPRSPKPDDSARTGIVQMQDNATVSGLDNEVLVKNETETFRGFTTRVARQAIRYEEMAAAAILSDERGPHPANFNSRYDNVLPGNPQLTSRSFNHAVGALTARVETQHGWEKDELEFVLLTSPYLMAEAARLVAGMEVRVSSNGDWHLNKATLARASSTFNPHLPIGEYNRALSWYVIARHQDPDMHRAGEIVFLDKLDYPWVTFQNPDFVGWPHGMDGHEQMAQQDIRLVNTRLIHTCGARITDPMLMVGSNGSGS